jgi:hypothetical protein
MNPSNQPTHMHHPHMNLDVDAMLKPEHPHRESQGKSASWLGEERGKNPSVPASAMVV